MLGIRNQPAVPAFLGCSAHDIERIEIIRGREPGSQGFLRRVLLQFQHLEHKGEDERRRRTARLWISDNFLRNNYWNGTDYSGRLDYSLPGNGSLSSSFADFCLVCRFFPHVGFVCASLMPLE